MTPKDEADQSLRQFASAPFRTTGVFCLAPTEQPASSLVPLQQPLCPRVTRWSSTKAAILAISALWLFTPSAHAKQGRTKALPTPPARRALQLPAFLALGGHNASFPLHPRTPPVEADGKLLCPSCNAGGRPLVAANLAVTGFAAVTAGTGAILAFAMPKSKSGVFKGSLRFAVTPTKAFASAVWRF